jgi:hypothetical protein
MIKIIRGRGSWYGHEASENEELPIGHSTKLNAAKTRYVDDGNEPQGVRCSERWVRWAEVVKAKGRMIIQITVEGPDLNAQGYPMGHCVGYLGIATVANVKFDPCNLPRFSCDIVDLKT